jgi:hypothetical protein
MKSAGGMQLTTGMKVMVTMILLGVGGLLVGLAGVIGDWYFARVVGCVSLFLVLAIVGLSAELKANTLDRILLGKTSRLKDDNNA